MYTLISSFLSALLCTFFIIRHCNIGGTSFLDDDLAKVQVAHITPVPRVGGIAVLVGLLIAAITNSLLNSPKVPFLWSLIIFCLPAFCVGLIEDVKKNLSVRIRLVVIGFSGIFFIYGTGSVITHLDIWRDQLLLSHYWVATLITLIAVCGLTNAYNIIDGLNGLASMVGVISLLAIAYVAFLVGDTQIPGAVFAMVGAIAGFFVWNYPRGLVFLGDGGSYIIGCWVAFLSILLIERHPSVSPWFAILVNAYPVFETLFSIYRKKIHRGISPGSPDGAHFHMLLYRRVVRWAGVNTSRLESEVIAENSKTSPYLWLLSSVAVIPAILFWRHTWVLQTSFFVFCIFYIVVYRSMVQFKAQKWLRRNRKIR